MRRRVETQLLAWQGRAQGRLPLLVFGARQVGKTYLLREFGRTHFQTTAYLNLETNPNAASYFTDDIAPSRLIPFLETQTGQRILPGRTLIILDEIQSAPRALTALKYFAEQAPQYHLAAAGSLLGVALNRAEQSYPVGNTTELTLHPLDFEEFCWALDEQALAEQIRACYDDAAPLPDALHQRALDCYRRYLVVGGMPRAVNDYLASGSLLGAADIQQGILNDYAADTAKYAAPSEAVKVRAAFDSMPAQLAKDNHKFQYKLAARGGTATIFGPAIDWLVPAGVALRCDRVSDGRLPLAAYRDLAAFKLYSSDVGLLSRAAGLPASLLLAPGDANVPFLGAVAENYVAQTLAAGGVPLYYWTSEGRAEMDFVVQDGTGIVPIEVKAGANTRSRSLSVFRQKYATEYAIRCSTKNFSLENDIKSVPLYAVHCIAGSLAR